MTDSTGEDPTVFQALKASHLRETLHSYGDALKARRKGIDKLNVYPVPDGDTGTNLSLTVQSVVSELKNAVADDMKTVAGAISKGAVMGARGNSGAILAQALRGISESVKDKASIGPSDVADALEKARTAAYQSVLKPVEGTMLTVLSAAADAARASADKGHELKEQMDHVRHASAEALARTPELLPVLKNAGVVDAGGSGFLLFIDALRYVVTGEPIPGAVDDDSDDQSFSPDIASAHTDLSELRYEVMYLLDAKDSKMKKFREEWATLGDSIVVVGGDGLWNCHIHTDEIGPTIEAGIAVGRPHQIRITDLQEQAGAEHGGAWTDAQDQNAGEEPVNTAVVAVVNGAGLKAIYESAGVSRIVSGGQSMNPSVADLLEAVEAAPSNDVIILPNNKNIRAAAEQVDSLTAKNVMVVPTTSVVAGMSALVSYDPAAAVVSNVEVMNDAADSVVCAEVTQAVRDAKTPVGDVKEGDWLGISADGIGVIAATLAEALVELVETLVGDDHEILTVVEGEGATTEATDALKAFLSQARPNIELDLHVGDQPLYPYFLGVE
jgi:DAK2 domain fusion protein YloV